MADFTVGDRVCWQDPYWPGERCGEILAIDDQGKATIEADEHVVIVGVPLDLLRHEGGDV